MGKFEEGFVPNATTKPGKESLSERWILSRMNHTVKRINEQLENREFSAATQALYGFIYENFCDVFIENSKALLEGSDEERRSSEFSDLDEYDDATNPIPPSYEHSLHRQRDKLAAPFPIYAFHNRRALAAASSQT